MGFSKAGPIRYLDCRPITDKKLLTSWRARGVIQASTCSLLHETCVVDTNSVHRPVTSSCYILDSCVVADSSHHRGTGATVVGLGDFQPDVPPEETASAIVGALLARVTYAASCKVDPTIKASSLLSSIVLPDFHPYAPRIVEEVLRQLKSHCCQDGQLVLPDSVDLLTPSSRTVTYLTDATHHEALVEAVCEGLPAHLRQHVRSHASIKEGTSIGVGSRTSGIGAASNFRLRLLRHGDTVKVFDAANWVSHNTAASVAGTHQPPSLSPEHTKSMDRTLMAYVAHLSNDVVSPEAALKRDSSVRSERQLLLGHATAVFHDVGLGHMYVSSHLGVRCTRHTCGQLFPALHRPFTAPSLPKSNANALRDQPSPLGGLPTTPDKDNRKKASQLSSEFIRSVEQFGQHASFVGAVLAAVQTLDHRFACESPPGLIDRLLQTKKGMDGAAGDDGFVTASHIEAVLELAGAIHGANAQSGGHHGGIVPVTKLFADSFGDLCEAPAIKQKVDDGARGEVVSEGQSLVAGSLITATKNRGPEQLGSPHRNAKRSAVPVSFSVLPVDVLAELRTSIAMLKSNHMNSTLGTSPYQEWFAMCAQDQCPQPSHRPTEATLDVKLVPMNNASHRQPAHQQRQKGAGLDRRVRNKPWDSASSDHHHTRSAPPPQQPPKQFFNEF